MNFSSDLSFVSRRSEVMACHGMVATSQPLASEIGLRILKQGGNAVDAAIAIAAALNVTEPCSTGIGGDCFLLYFCAKTTSVYALNGSGRAPHALTRDRVLKDCPGSKTIPMNHAHSITVPGTVAGWVDAVEKWGSLEIKTILQPAIDLATEGFPVSPVTAHHWERGLEQLKSGPYAAELLINGSAPKAGQIFANPGLATCLEEIAQHGKKGFYEGRIAQEIISLIEQCGGVLDASDLQTHETTFPEPISVNFQGVDIYEVPPNGQGITALIALNILSELFQDPESIPPHNSPEYLHCLIEALRLAFVDTRWYVADPKFSNVPIQELLSKTYAKSRAALIDRTKCIVDPERGQPVLSSDTVSFQVVDGEGNAVSMVNSNYAGFGTGLIPKGCGFTLQNRGGNFSLEQGHPNMLEPKKRPYHTIIPGMAVCNGKLHSSFTVMGGFMQPQGHVQILMNMLVFRMTPQLALDSHRFCIGSAHGSGRGAFDGVSIEGVDDDTLNELRSKGHKVTKLDGHERCLFGRGQIICRDPETGVLSGGSDGRADGCALGW